MAKRVAIHTLGCKVNQYDSDAVAAEFGRQGYQIVDFSEQADVYVINTCTVTNIGDRKSRQAIRRASRRNPAAKIVVMGCFAQTAPEQVTAIPGVSLVVGTDDRVRVVDLVDELTADEIRSLVRPIEHAREFEELSVVHFQGRTRAFLKIQDGCDQYCSYCKVPYARGRSRSRSMRSVLHQVEAIVAQGYKEIVLTGVHLGAYGRDLPTPTNLSHAVEQICDVDGVHRIRISSIDANEVDRDLLELVADHPKVCRHLHIPLQSGSDAILRRMRRRYSTNEYRQVVEQAYQLVGDLAITTDVIVGFPGETDAHFEQTRSFLVDMGFSRLHVFRFSPREATPAAGFPGQIANRVKESRSQSLVDLGRRLSRSYHQRFLGRCVDVLVEEQSSSSWEGFTDHYIRTQIRQTPEEESLGGHLVSVQVDHADDQMVAGFLGEQGKYT